MSTSTLPPATRTVAPAELATQWLSSFEAALQSADPEQIAALFLPDGYWRDIVALTWDWGWVQGNTEIGARLAEVAAHYSPKDFVLFEGRSEPQEISRNGRDVIEAHFRFELDHGHGEGVVRLVADSDDAARAFIVLTALSSVKGREPLAPPARRPGLGFAPKGSTLRYNDYRQAKSAYADRDPEVLVVGGGHSGLAVAARLGQVGVDALVVDTYERAGDNWRNRYDSLALHTITELSPLPYTEFPTTFPKYLPKDQLANFLEHYADQLEINLWKQTEFLGGSYDEAGEVWTVRVRNTVDGTERELRPRHVVIATGGMSGTPNLPDIPGLSDYAGEVMHASAYKVGTPFAGKRVLIIGAATSAHDIALDVLRYGGEPTLFQRSATIVTSIEASDLAFSDYADPYNSREEKDILGHVDGTYPLFVQNLQGLVQACEQIDAELLAGLRKAGMKLDQGPDNTGYLMKTYRQNGGYYLNVGASDEIVAGNIKVIGAETSKGLVAEGLELNDGTVVPFDAVILSTGYANLKEDVRTFFGDDVAEKVGLITGLDENGETRNAWRPTPQKGLWFQTGGIGQGRICSIPLTQLITAAIVGVMPGYAAVEGE